MNPACVAFIGGGNMARSLIGGLIASGRAPASIRVAEPNPAPREALARDFGVFVTGANAEAAAGASLLVLAVKPPVMPGVCRELAPVLERTRAPVLSIAAGVRLAQLERWLGAQRSIVRAMPNTPALIGRGVAALVANARCGPAERQAAETVLAAAGVTIWIDDEARMDAVTAVSGSGPAYFFALIEALEAAAVAAGLEPAVARRLVLETAAGAAAMARASADTPSRLREQVTSPGGTTAAALAVLEAGGFQHLVLQAVARAVARAGELSAALDAP